MTNEELDEARVKEGWRIVQDRPPTHVFFFGEVGRVVARLAREGWTPPEPVSDDVLAARALLKTQLSEVLHGEVLLPVVREGLVEGGVLLDGDIIGLAHPDGLLLVEVAP